MRPQLLVSLLAGVLCSCGPLPCAAECGALRCGPDPKCSTSCGRCGLGETCVAGQCQPAGCDPDCAGRECGPDRLCGVSCGTCVGDATCAAGQCVPPAVSCSAPATSGSCSTAGNLWCGSSACCSPLYPYHCRITGYCYATREGAVAACGAGCERCAAPGVANTCSAAPAGTCSTAGHLYCGSGTCCAAGWPYFCPANSNCYATQATALAGCGGACVKCGGGYRCGGTGDSCPQSSCCGGRTGTICCMPPFCAGDCAYSPCC